MQLPSLDKLKLKHGELCGVKEAKKILGFPDSKQLMDMIASGILDGFYFKKDIDYVSSDGKKQYVFVTQKLIEIKKMPHLPTLDQLQEKIGKTLVGAGLVQNKLVLSGEELNQRLKEGYFDSIKFEAGIDFQPTGRTKLVFILEELDSARKLPTIEEFERLNGMTCGFNQAAKILGIGKEAFSLILNAGLLDEVCYKRNIHFELSNRRRNEFAFNVSQLSDLRKKWLRLNEIAKELNTSYSSLKNKIHSAADILNEAKVYPDEKVFLWDYTKFRKLLPLAEETIRQRQSVGVLTKMGFAINHYDYLPKWLQERVNEYFTRRTSKACTITFNGIVLSGKRLSKKNVDKDVRPNLCRFLFRLICVLCGIKQFYRIVDGIDLLNPPDSEWEKWNPEEFKLERLKIETFEEATSDMSNKTFNIYYRIFKPFFYFLLMKLDEEQEEKRIEEKWSLEKRAVERMVLDDVKSRIVNILNNYSRVETSAPDEGKKVFLTREEFLRIWAYLKEKNGLKFALMFAVGTMLGLRKEETTLVAVEDFWIDLRTGLLLADSDGFGRLFLPKQKSKQDKGASHRIYGTLIPPILVQWINFYLEYYLYPKCPFSEHKQHIEVFEGKISGKLQYSNGHGYLFRQNDYLPNSNYTINNLAKLLPKIRHELTFLNLKERQHLSFHDTRHTLNEWIETCTNIPTSLYGIRDEAADLQMRHDMERNSQDVGKNSYRYKTEKFIIKEEEYKAIIDAALNFPWDLKLLRVWEIEQGFRSNQETEVKISENESVQIEAPGIIVNNGGKEPIVEIAEHQRLEVEKLIKQANSFLDLAEPPNGTEFMAWLHSRKVIREALERMMEAYEKRRLDVWEVVNQLASSLDKIGA